MLTVITFDYELRDILRGVKTSSERVSLDAAYATVSIESFALGTLSTYINEVIDLCLE